MGSNKRRLDLLTVDPTIIDCYSRHPGHLVFVIHVEGAVYNHYDYGQNERTTPGVEAVHEESQFGPRTLNMIVIPEAHPQIITYNRQPEEGCYRGKVPDIT